MCTCGCECPEASKSLFKKIQWSHINLIVRVRDRFLLLIKGALLFLQGLSSSGNIVGPGIQLIFCILGLDKRNGLIWAVDASVDHSLND